MKTLIIYASNRKRIKEIYRHLKNSKINILNQDEALINYNLIIIETSIRMEMIDKRIKKVSN